MRTSPHKWLQVLALRNISPVYLVWALGRDAKFKNWKITETKNWIQNRVPESFKIWKLDFNAQPAQPESVELQLPYGSTPKVVLNGDTDNVWQKRIKRNGKEPHQCYFMVPAHEILCLRSIPCLWTRPLAEQSNVKAGIGWRQIIPPCFTELWLLGLGENFSTICYADCNGNGPKPINLRAIEVWILTLTLAPEMPFCNAHTVYHFDSVFPVSFFFKKNVLALVTLFVLLEKVLYNQKSIRSLYLLNLTSDLGTNGYSIVLLKVWEWAFFYIGIGCC